MEHAVGICDRSGFKYPLRELVKQYDGMMVHPRHLDQRHPSDTPHTPRPERALPYSRPESADVFLDTNEVTASSL